MFIMQGEEVKLVRHVISYAEDENEMQEMCVSDEHKREVEKLLSNNGSEFVSEAVDQTANEWFNGLHFNSYDTALIVFNAGEEAYLQDKRKREATNGTQLRADVDYLSLVARVNL